MDHFKAQGLNDEQVEEATYKHVKWYSIVDGSHSNEAAKKLCTNLNEWKGLQWFVSILNGGHNLEKYSQLSRAQKARHSPRYYVELTFFDELKNLRLELEHLLEIQTRLSKV